MAMVADCRCSDKVSVRYWRYGMALWHYMAPTVRQCFLRVSVSKTCSCTSFFLQVSTWTALCSVTPPSRISPNPPPRFVVIDTCIKPRFWKRAYYPRYYRWIMANSCDRVTLCDFKNVREWRRSFDSVSPYFYFRVVLCCVVLCWVPEIGNAKCLRYHECQKLMTWNACTRYHETPIGYHKLIPWSTSNWYPETLPTDTQKHLRLICLVSVNLVVGLPGGIFIWEK